MRNMLVIGTPSALFLCPEYVFAASLDSRSLLVRAAVRSCHSQCLLSTLCLDFLLWHNASRAAW